MCLNIAEKIELSKFIRTNTNRNKNHQLESKIISDACEAIIGAIFLDQGIKITENFILNKWNDFIISTKDLQMNSKTKLQEYSLKNIKSTKIQNS